MGIAVTAELAHGHQYLEPVLVVHVLIVELAHGRLFLALLHHRFVSNVTKALGLLLLLRLQSNNV